MAPFGELLRTLRACRLHDERRQHFGGGVGAEHLHGFERLVREVDRVAAVDEYVIGDCREHHRFDFGKVRGIGQRSLECAFGGIARTGFDEPAIPALQSPQRHLGGRQRTDRETRRLIAGVVRDEGQAVHERERPVVALEVGKQIRHQHGQARAPTGAAIRRAEVDTRSHDVGRTHARIEQPEHRLGDDERDALLESVAQARLQVADRIGIDARLDEHVAVAHLGPEPTGVVGPHVERASRHEVEAGVVPVTRHEAGLDGALVQREAEVRAPVLDRVHRVLVPEDHDRDRSDLRDEPALFAELVERPGPYRLVDHPVPFARVLLR